MLLKTVLPEHIIGTASANNMLFGSLKVDEGSAMVYCVIPPSLLSPASRTLEQKLEYPPRHSLHLPIVEVSTLAELANERV
jgi:hypothetical protein